MSIPRRNDDDPWQLYPVETSAGSPEHLALRFQAIENIHPLDAQLGRIPKKTVPDQLYAVLFDQPDPVLTEIEMAGGDLTAVPPIRTYAILDAAKVVNLPELLEHSGLEHRCLFKNQAQEDYGDVAPWLVELNPDSRLLRQLFTRAEGPGHFWDAEAAVFLRSRSGIDQLWRHLRKFTQLRDAHGRMRYFRFWQADLLLDILSCDTNQTALSRAFLAPGPSWHIQDVIGIDREGEGAALHLAPLPPMAPTPVPQLAGKLEALILAATQRRRIRQMARALHRDFAVELAGVSPSKLREAVAQSVWRMHAYRFISVPLLYMLAAWELFYGPLDQISDPEGHLARDLRSHLSEQRKFLRIKARLTQLDQGAGLPRRLGAVGDGAPQPSGFPDG